MANSTTLYQLHDGRMAVDVTENKTLAAKDVGVVQNVIADGLTITLPATVVGYHYTVRNGGVPKTGGPAGSGDDESVAVVIAPNASDYIQGLEHTASDADTLTNTKATAKVGDEISLVADGANGYFATQLKGTWAWTAV